MALGKVSAFTLASWQERLKLPILQLESQRGGDQDFDLIRKLLAAGRNQIVDRCGIDWWGLIGILVSAELGEAILLGRLAQQLDPAAELYSTRQGWPASGVALLLKRPLQTHPGAMRPSQFHRYGDMFRRFSFDQLAQIFLDKYDSRYRLRGRFAARRQGPGQPFVLLPSAYTNVSRTAVSYASMLPEQPFLVVATRRSGTHFSPSPNVSCMDLAAYAGGPGVQPEYLDILNAWQILQERLALFSEMNLLLRAGVLEKFPNYFRDGLAVRNAWQNVLSREKIVAVMCGDDSNPYTKLPVLLARKQGIPTLNFHHGALDGRFLIKELSSDLYLAKGEMERDYLVRICGLPAERVVIAGPGRPQSIPVRELKRDENSRIVFFSEPYESGGRRSEDIYRELLPLLSRIAREFDRKVVVKLHPFESLAQRAALVAKVLGREDADRVEVVEGPFAPQLVANAWFAVTVESSTVIDCSLLGVPCFVCEWLSSSPYGYTHQYARFGVGRILKSSEQMNDLPRMMLESPIPVSNDSLVKPMDPEWLRRIIATGVATGVKSAFSHSAPGGSSGMSKTCSNFNV